MCMYDLSYLFYPIKFFKQSIVKRQKQTLTISRQDKIQVFICLSKWQSNYFKNGKNFLRIEKSRAKCYFTFGSAFCDKCYSSIWRKKISSGLSTCRKVISTAEILRTDTHDMESMIIPQYKEICVLG